MAIFIILIQIACLSMATTQHQVGVSPDRWSFLVTLVRNAPLLSSTPWLLPSQPASTVGIRDDYTYTSGIGAHKFHKRSVTWNEARRICDEEGGHLAIINSVAESNAIVDVYKSSGGINFSTFAYIGFHDMFQEGEFVTLHSHSLSKSGYTGWGNTEPNGGVVENCGAVNKDSVLIDIGCDAKIGFICELPVVD